MTTRPAYQRWEPVPRILYGFAIKPFSPESDVVHPTRASARAQQQAVAGSGSSGLRGDRDEDVSIADPGASDIDAESPGASAGGGAEAASAPEDEAAASERRRAHVAAVQAQLIGLEVGDEVYVFEQLGHAAHVEWYRGYVVSSLRTPVPALSLRSLSDFSNFPPAGPGQDAHAHAAGPVAAAAATAGVVEEPQVIVGLFPATHVHVRAELDDAEGRMAQVYHAAKEAGIVGATAPPAQGAWGGGTLMETLPEEEEEGHSGGSPRQQRAARRDPSASPGEAAAAAAGQALSFARNRQSIALPEFNSDKPAPPLPSLRAGDTTQSGLAEPLVDEIACALREWGALLYGYLARREYALFAAVREHLGLLHAARRQLLAQTLSAEEVAKLRRECVARLVKGNLIQGLDVIVRHPGRGALVDVEFAAAAGSAEAKQQQQQGSSAGANAQGENWVTGIRLFALQAALAYVDQETGGATGAIDIQSSTAFGITATSSAPSGMLAALASAITGAAPEPVPMPGRKQLSRASRKPSISLSRGGSSSGTNGLLGSNDGQPQQQQQQGASTSTPSVAKYFHVSLEVCAFVASPCAVGETAELYFSLYNKAEARFLTEEYCVVLNHHGVPVRGSSGVEGRLDKMRALFSDLSPGDMGDLHLVCRIVRNGAMRMGAHDARIAQLDASASADNPYEIPDEVSNSGARRSKMTTERTFRRPFGCAVLDLGQQHQLAMDVGASSPLKEHTMPIFTPVNEASFSTLHQDIIASRIKELEKSPRAEMVAVTIKTFYGDTDSLVREHSSLLQDAVITARLGFPDVVFPGDQRNEAYLKLWSGEFFPQVAKALGPVASAKNIQVSVEVRDDQGRVLENVISRGSGEPLVSEFDSIVFYHQNAPTWGELVKLELPDDIIEHCHLFFTIRHRSAKEEKGIAAAALAEANKPVAYGYLPLFQPSKAFVADGSHAITLFRSQRHGSALSPDLYFNLNPTVDVGRSGVESIPIHLQGVFQPLKDSLIVRTFLVSTRYTQNEIVLRLINWQTSLAHDLSTLRAVLSQFMFVAEVEIVKFLRDIFDALFGILMSTNNSQGELDELVFNALVTVLGLVQDRRFTNFRATLDIYIEQHFRFTNAHVRLLASLNRLLADPSAPSTSKDLRSSIKVWPYLFRLIVQSRENQKASSSSNPGGGTVNDHLDRTFRQDLQELLQGVNRLMSASKPSAIIGTQTLALQHFAGTYPDLLRVFSLEEMVKISTSFIDATFVTKGRMAIWKLLHILHLVGGVLFERPAARAQLTPSVVRWVRPHLGAYDAALDGDTGTTPAARDAARITWAESARLAVTVIAVVLDRLQRGLVEMSRDAGSGADLRQEQDNVDYLLSTLPRLLTTYRELRSPLLMEAIERHRSPSTIPSAAPVVFPATYPFPLLARAPAGHPFPASAPSSRRHKRRAPLTMLNCGLGEVVAVIDVLLMLSPRKRLDSFLEELLDLEGPAATASTLLDFFDFADSQLDNEAFPATWLNFDIFTHQMILKMLEPVADLLIKDFIPNAPDQSPENFDSELWTAGLSTLLNLLSSPQLVVEDFKPQRRRAVWRLAGDIRGEGAQLFARLWHAIGWPDEHSSEGQQEASDRMNTGGFQVQFVPNLVEPVLELCLSHHDELRTCAVRVLATMITSEWHLNGDFSIIEAEIIDKLDILFTTDTKGDEISRAFFIGQLRSLFEDPDVDPKLQEQVNGCLSSVNRFLDLLLSVRSLPFEEGYEDDRIAGTLKLLGFLRQANRVTAFSTHVLRLVNLHLERRDFVEAALTLKLYADLMTWDLDALLDSLPDLCLPQQSHFARKETLYLLIIDYLSKGEAWEISIDICRELAQQYEYRSANYARLGELLMHQASLYQKVAAVERSFPAYFRVAYYGERWPASLQSQMFVYRGQASEKFNAFCERLQQQHPRAILIKGSSPPTDEVRFGEGQYIHVTALQPEVDRNKDVFTNSETSPMIRAYYEHNATDLFSFSRPIEGPAAPGDRRSLAVDGSVDVFTLWVEKTYLRCEDAFPTVLRRSKVAEVESVEVSPLENALTDVVRKKQELETLEKKYLALSKLHAAGTINTNRLSMALNAAVDAPVNGGTPMYKRAFLSPDFAPSQPEEEELVQLLREAIDEQASVIYRCIRLHARICPPEMRPFHQTLERFFRQNFLEEVGRLALDLQQLNVPVDGSSSMTSLHADESARGPLSSSVRIGVDLPGAGQQGTQSAYYMSPLQRHIQWLNTLAGESSTFSELRAEGAVLAQNGSSASLTETTGGLSGALPTSGSGNGGGDQSFGTTRSPSIGNRQQDSARPGTVLSMYNTLTSAVGASAGMTVRSQSRMTARERDGFTPPGGAGITGYSIRSPHDDGASFASSADSPEAAGPSSSGNRQNGSSNGGGGGGGIFSKYTSGNRLSKLMGSRKAPK